MPAYKDEKKKSKKNIWYTSFYYTNWKGKQEHKTKRGFPTKKAAEQWERDFIQKHSQSCDMLFKNFVEIYREDCKRRHRARTYKNQQYIIDDKILPAFGEKKLNEITAADVRNWQNELLDYRDEDGEPYKPTYLNTINIKLSAIFNFACKNYGLQSNPCRSAGSLGSRNAEEISFWVLDDFNDFIECVTRPATRLAFLILYYSGIRTCELLALQPKDILPDMELDITKSYAKVDGVQMYTDAKSRKSKRKVSIPKFLYDEIQDYISKLYRIRGDERIFEYEEHWLQHEIKRYSAVAYLDPITPHGLRHSHASLLIELGYELIEISRRLGHESIKTTADTYGHLFPTKAKKIAFSLDRLQKKPELLSDILTAEHLVETDPAINPYAPTLVHVGFDIYNITKNLTPFASKLLLKEMRRIVENDNPEMLDTMIILERNIAYLNNNIKLTSKDETESREA